MALLELIPGPSDRRPNAKGKGRGNTGYSAGRGEQRAHANTGMGGLTEEDWDQYNIFGSMNRN